MRASHLLIATLAALPPSTHVRAEEAAPSRLNYHAVVIGVSDYADHGAEGWSDLRTASRDAAAIAGVLEKNYGFKVTRLLDGDATRGAVIAALDRIAALGPNDACLVFFAGHGSYSERTGEGYWIPCDARATDGKRKPVEDWVWNSTLTRLCDASQARHILVLSDSCYSGSLFRGGNEMTNPDLQYYRRSVRLPARQLLTSGDLEPVPDGGAVNSKFTEQVLQFLSDPDRKVFAASELGVAVCRRVSSLTGTLPRFGPLNVGAHAGGDFVFAAAGVDLPPGDAPTLALGRSRAGDPLDALVLDEQGWGLGARLLAGQALAAPKSAESQDVSGDVTEMLKSIDADLRKKPPPAPAAVAPGTWVLLPFKISAEGVEPARAAALFRERLARQLRASGAQVLNRADLEAILREHQLSASDLTDPARKLEVGRLLPAARLVSGEVIPDGDQMLVFLSVTDTATSELRLLDEVDMNKADIKEVGRKLKAED